MDVTLPQSLTLGASQVEEPRLDVSRIQQGSIAVPEGTADLRSVKYDFALGDSSPGVAKVKSLLQSPGGEDQLREQAKLDEEKKRWEAAMELFKDVNTDSGTLQDTANAAKKPVSKDQVLEKKYAEKTLGLSLSLTESPDEVNQAAQEAPVMSGAMYDAFSKRLAQHEGFLKLAEDADAEYQASGWGKFAGDIAIGLIPTYTWSTQRNKTLGETLTSWLPGSNKEEQYAYLRSMEPDESVLLAKQIYNEIAHGTPGNPEAGNLVEARQWVQDLLEYNNAGVDDAFGALDALSLTPIGTAIRGTSKAAAIAGRSISARQALREARKGVDDFNRVKATRLPDDTKTALQVTLDALESKRLKLTEDLVLKVRSGDMQKAAVIKSILQKVTEDSNSLRSGLDELSTLKKDAAAPLLERLRRTTIAARDKHLDLPKILSGSGHTKEAARLKAAELAKKMAPNSGKTMVREIEDLLDNTPSFYNPNKFMLDAATFHDVRANRIADALTRNVDLFARSIEGVANVSRLPVDIEKAALDAAEASIRDQYRNVNDAVIHAVERYHSTTNPFTNSAYIETVFGKSDGTLFKTPQSALNTGKNRYGLPITEKDIYQEGDGYAIRIRKDINETTDAVRDRLITVDNGSQTQKNKLFSFIPTPKAIHSAKDSVSKFQAAQRAATTHATTATSMFYTRMADTVSKLSKTEYEDLSTIMKLNRDTAGPDGKRGMFYKSAFELESVYVQKFNRLPTEQEVAAYQTFVQLSDAHYLSTASSQLTAKSRQGVERVTADIGDGEFVFEGRKVDFVPFDSKHIASVYYKPSPNAKGKYYRLSEIRAEDQKEINKAVKEGRLSVTQTHNPDDDGLRAALKVSGGTNFVVLPSVKRGPLKLTEQLGYRPGGHVKYKDELFIKQPKVFTDSTNRKVYGGDTVALGVSNTAKAAKELSLLERARLAVKIKDDTALRSVIDDGLPMTIDEIKNVFKTRFDVDTPFAVVRSGQSVADPSVLLGSGKNLEGTIGHFDDYSNSPFNISKGTSDEFLGQKDGPLYSIKNSGTEDKPVWEMGEARTFDPIDTMTQTMGKLIRSKHYNDYQISAAESFVQEFGVQKGLIHLGGKPVSASDLRRNPGYYLSQGNIVGVGAEAETARNIQRSIRNLVSHKSLLSNHISNFQAKLLSSAYERSGEKYIDTIDNWSALLKSDLPSKLRAIAFHTKLGLGNPVQVLLQSQTLFNIGFISPKHGPAGTLVSAWMRKLDLLPGDQQVVKDMAKKAAKMNPSWTAEQFEESHKLLKQTGFDLIGGDLSWRNDIADPKLFTSKAGQFLEWGAGLFNGTERFVRLASWNTAYKEYLEKFPKLAGKMDANDAKTILSRAQDLSGNMTRDGHAFWQEGAASTVTQFWGYTGRMFDLMTGMRLTAGEKARLLSGWSVMYGLPVAGTALAPVWPYKDSVREMLLAHETNPDEGLVGLIMNGMLSTGVAAVTGDHYDVGARYGVGEIPVVKTLTDLKYGEDAWDAISQIALGASGSIVGDIIKDGAPVVGDLMNMVHGEGKGTLLEDANDLFSNISTYKQGERAIAIARTGMHMTKDERVIASGRDPFEGIGHFITGLEKTDVANARAMEKVVRSEQNLQTQARRDAKEYIRMYFQSINDADPEQAKVYVQRARTIMIGGGLTEKQMIDTINSVRKEKTILDTSTDKYIKAGKTPEEQIQRQEVVQ